MTIKPSLFYLVVGSVSFLLLSSFVILILLYQVKTYFWVAVMFGFFSMLCAYLIIYYFVFRIIFTSQNITIYGVFLKKEIMISSISQVKLIGNPKTFSYELYLLTIDKKKISISSTCDGFDLALKKIREMNIKIIEQEYNTFSN